MIIKILLKKEISFFELLLSQYINKDFFFVQIGANDGKKWDPIFKYVNFLKISGIALEPVKEIYKKLVLNYKNNQQVKLINKAIHNTEKEAILYKVNPEIKNIPDWTEGTASFLKSHHQLSGFDETMLIEEKVSCISFNELILQEKISTISLLQIDTEGYDFEIINSINFDVIKPRIISFEHGIKSNINSVDSFNILQNYLRERGYKFWINDFDAIAFLD